MKHLLVLSQLIVSLCISGFAQQNAAQIYAQIKKIRVLGTVLYIAAHPDDENNSFLPYLSKEKNFRTAYLSLTRGDGGQNLIGKEQGVELGLIRTQELLAARAQDGAEQYFATAYEFGFSKSAKEALSIWDHQKVLSDVVWMIRNLQPDVIITRFPGDARAGHGHHAASAIIANEAFEAAADPTKFPDQLKNGVTVWKAKRILWNTFNFGNINTTNSNQFKMEVGAYNALIGKSYGEIGAEARSMHKSQGEGRTKRRGMQFEYFETTGGEAPIKDLMDGVNTSWSRLHAMDIQNSIDTILMEYQFENPAASVKKLVQLYAQIQGLHSSVWKNYQLKQLQQIIQDAAGIYLEAVTQKEQAIPGTKIPTQVLINQRSNLSTILEKISYPNKDTLLKTTLSVNQNYIFEEGFTIPETQPISQPYWLEYPKTEGMFNVTDYQKIGKPENDPVFQIGIQLQIAGLSFNFMAPLQYKYTDPTKGDVYQPFVIIPNIQGQFEKELYLKKKDKPLILHYQLDSLSTSASQSKTIPFTKNTTETIPIPEKALMHKTIHYDHIPNIHYFMQPSSKVLTMEVKATPLKIGYIEGAGDKIPEALRELGYQVETLHQTDINTTTLKQYAAILIGIRAYNMHEFLTQKNEILNNYIKEGGNLIVQYLKSNQVGIQKINAGPYAFTVNPSKRVTQENVPVSFVLPQHPVLNMPNKIMPSDFDNWVQERSTYQAENVDPHFAMPLSMQDENEPSSTGSLLIAPYGKGNMVYLSVTLFRQLPAGNPGAFKLLANLVELPKH